jgi:soluble lytic murein transglycosylase-like protein
MQKRIYLSFLALLLAPAAPAFADQSSLQGLIASHASANNIPEALVHRVIRRESNYNPRAVGSGGAMGLMQIKHATARGMGYKGTASGLLDADTNLTYAVRYLAGAYRVAGGNFDRAVRYYAAGYYYAAKRLGITKEFAQRPATPPVRWASADKAETTGAIRREAVAVPRPTLAELR